MFGHRMLCHLVWFFLLNVCQGFSISQRGCQSHGDIWMHSVSSRCTLISLFLGNDQASMDQLVAEIFLYVGRKSRVPYLLQSQWSHSNPLYYGPLCQSRSIGKRALLSYYVFIEYTNIDCTIQVELTSESLIRCQ